MKLLNLILVLAGGVAFLSAPSEAQTVYLRPMNDANNCLVVGTNGGTPDKIYCKTAVPFSIGDRVLCANMTGDTAPNRDDLKVASVDNSGSGSTAYGFTVTNQSGTPIASSGTWKSGANPINANLPGNAQICGKVQPYTLKSRPFLWTDPTGRSGIEMAAKINNALLTNITVNGSHIPTVNYAVSITGTGIHTCTSCFGIYGATVDGNLNGSTYNITAVGSNSITLSATTAAPGTYTDTHLSASAWAFTGNLWWDALLTPSWNNRWLTNGPPPSPIGILPNYWGLEGAAVRCYVNELDTNACNTAKWAVLNFEDVTSSGSFALYESNYVQEMINTLDFGTRFGGDIARSYELLLSIPGMLSPTDKTTFANKVLNSYIPAGETCTKPSPVDGSGVASFVVDNTTPTIIHVTGVGTSFLSELVDGDVLRSWYNPAIGTYGDYTGSRDSACQIFNMAGATNTTATCYKGSYGPPVDGKYTINHAFSSGQCGFTIFTAHKGGGATWPGQTSDQPPGGYVSAPFTNQIWPRVGGLGQLGLVTCPDDPRGCYLFESVQAFFADYVLPPQFSLATGTMGCGTNYDYSVCMWAAFQDALVLKNAVVNGPDWSGNDMYKWFGDWTRYHHIPGLPAPIDSTFFWNSAYPQTYGGGGQPINGYDPNADGWDFGQTFSGWLALNPTSTTTGKYQYWIHHDWPSYNIGTMGGGGLEAGFSFETSYPTIPEINYHSTDPLGMLFTPTTNQLNSCLNQGTQTWQYPCRKNLAYNQVISRTGWDLTPTSPDTFLSFSGETTTVERSGPRFLEWYLFKGDELIGSEDTAVNNFGAYDLSTSNGTSNPCTVHSASYTYSTIDVGNKFTFDIAHSGANWSAGSYTILSVSGGNANISGPCGTAASLTGGAWIEAMVLRGQRNNRGYLDYGNSRYNQFQLGPFVNQFGVDGEVETHFDNGNTTVAAGSGFPVPNFDQFLTSDVSGHQFTYAHLDCTTCVRYPTLANSLTRSIGHKKNGTETIGVYTYADTSATPTTIVGDFVNYQQNGQTTEGVTTCPGSGGCANLTTNKEILSLSSKSGVHSKFLPVGNSLVFMEYTNGTYSANSQADRFFGDGTRGNLFPLGYPQQGCGSVANLCWNVSAKGNVYKSPPSFTLSPRGGTGIPLTGGEYGVDSGKDYYWTQGSPVIHQDPSVGLPLRTSFTGHDLSTTNGLSALCTIHSPTYSFVTQDVGSQVVLDGTGGWNNAGPFIDSVSGGDAVIHSTCGSSNTLTNGNFTLQADLLLVQYNILSTGYSGDNVMHVGGCAGSGASCDPAATSYEMVQVHVPFYGTTDPGLSVTALNPDSNWTGFQTSDTIMLFARGGNTHVTMTDYTPANNGTTNYLYGGLVAGTYNISVGGTPVTGSPFTVAAGVHAVEFSAPTSGVVHLSGTAAGCTITSTSPLLGGTISVPYTYTYSTTGCIGAVNWIVTSGALPGGLILHAGTGVIDGTPNASGPFTFTVSVTDSASPTPSTGSLPSSITIAGSIPIHHILMDGQSLSQGLFGNFDSSLTQVGPLSTSQPYSNLMLGDGCNWNGSNCDFSGSPSLNPLIESVNPTTGATGGGVNTVETLASGMANTLSLLSGGSFTSLVSHHGWTGAAYSALQRNPTSPTLPITGTAYYQSLVDAVTSAKADAASASRSYSVDALVITHGETDFQNHMTAASYVSDLLQWQSDVSFDRNRLNSQTGTIPMFIDQMQTWLTVSGLSTPTTDGTLNPSNPSTPLGQWIAARDNPTKVFLTGPKYGNLSLLYYDNLHLVNSGYRLLGGYHAKAIKKVVVDGGQWVPLSPRSISIASNVITLRLWVPAGTVTLDTSTLPDYTACSMVADPTVNTNPTTCRSNGGTWRVKGLEFYDSTNSAYITSVTVASGDTLTITLNAAPTGSNQRLRSAYSTRLSTGDFTHNWSIGTNIRDTDTTLDNSGNHLYDWLITFDEPMGFNWNPFGSCAITTSGALPGGTIGTSYSQGIATINCNPQPPTSNWSIASGSLCPGLSINSSTGVISGTPTGAPTTCTFTVQVIDSEPTTATSSSLSITIGGGSGSLTVSPGSLHFSCTTASNPVSQGIAIGATGIPLDNWSASKTQSFTTLTPSLNSVASTMSVGITCIGQTVGVLTDSITISSSTTGMTGNNPVVVPVTVTVSAPTNTKVVGNPTYRGNTIIH